MNPHPTPYREELPDGTFRPLDLQNYRHQQARQGFDETRQDRMERVAPAVIENQEVLAIREERRLVHEQRGPLAAEWNHAMRIVRTIGDGMPRFAELKRAAERELSKIEADMLPLDLKLRELANKELELCK